MQEKITPILTYIFPRLSDAIFVGLLMAVFIHGPALLNGDGDLGRHITIGNYIRDSGTIPTRDIFSHTMTGEPLVPHEWLAQLTFSMVHGLSGLTGVVLLIAFLIATTFTLTYRAMVRRNVFRILALLIAMLAAYSSGLHWLARPHVFTFLLAALWTYQIDNEKSKVWLFPLIMWVWANTHGAFIAGFVILGAHLAGWLWEYLGKRATREAGIRLIAIGALSLVVTVLNPAGWHLWGTSVGYFGSQYLIDHTVEYQSPNFHNWSTWPFLVMLGLGSLTAGFGGKWRPHESILFAGWAVLSLYSARNIPLFAIITAPYLGTALQAVVERISLLQQSDQRIARVEHRLRGITWPVLAVIALAISTYRQPIATNTFDPNKFPVEAANWLEANPQSGKMFNNFIWGGYLLYRMWPEQVVFIDGQTDFYGEALTREYAQVMYLEDGWESVLEKYDVSWVIVPSGRSLVTALQEGLGWTVVYHDSATDILRKP